MTNNKDFKIIDKIYKKRQKHEKNTLSGGFIMELFKFRDKCIACGDLTSTEFNTVLMAISELNLYSECFYKYYTMKNNVPCRKDEQFSADEVQAQYANEKQQHWQRFCKLVSEFIFDWESKNAEFTV